MTRSANVQSESVSVTTDQSGDATVRTVAEYTGWVSAILYTKTDFADTVDFDVTGNVTGQVLWDEDNVTASKTIAPRQATHSTAGVASLYAAAGTAVQDRIYVRHEKIKFVVANGGDTKIGAFRVVVVTG